VSQDVAKSSDDDATPRLYNTFLQWRERKGVLQRVRLGRQRIYSGVGYATVDGVDLGLRLGKYFRVSGFAGFLVPVTNSISIDKWDNSNAYGASASFNHRGNSKILISFMQRNRRPMAYISPGRYTERLLTFPALEQRLLGLDIFQRFTRQLNAYGRLDYDTVQDRIRRAQLELRAMPARKIELSVEFFHRAPLVEANSIFAVFDHGTSRDIRGRASYLLDNGWSIYGDVGYQKYSAEGVSANDNTVRFGIGARCRYGYVGYNFRRGYGGLNNGLYAALNYPVTRQVGLLISTGYSRYSLFDVDAEKYSSLLGSVGFNYRASKNFSLDVVGQGLHNRFYDNDLRLLAKANYWFFSNFR
jgi:hypothetical protein